MKNKILAMFRKAALPAMLALTLSIPVGAMAARGGGGGGHFGGGGGGHAVAGARGFSGGGGYYRGGGAGVVRGGGGYYRGGYYGGGLYLGFGAPYYGYGYGYGYPAAPAPCGTYDQYGNWIPTACAVPPYGY